jgi:hypothetical protein
MSNSTQDPSMREAECPFCERVVLVYEEPPRCPLCACPLDDERTRPFAFPDERGARDAGRLEGEQAD